MKYSFLLHLICLFILSQTMILGQGDRVNNQQSLFFKEFTTADGLPSPTTHNTFQDKFGFLWISTDEGLTRYDGYLFKPYYNDPETKIRLKGACGFYEDDQDQLWVINAAGFLHLYNRAEDIFLSIESPFEDGWMEPDAHAIVGGTNGDIWFSSYGGIVQYDPVKKDTIRTIKIEEIRAPRRWPHSEKVRCGPIHLQEGKVLWIGTRKFGFIKVDLNNGSKHYYRFDPKYNRQLLDDWITEIVQLDESTLLIADYATGLVLWDLDKEEVKEVIRVNVLLGVDKDVPINDLHIVDEDRVWVATEGSGLLLLNITLRHIEQSYIPDANPSLSIGDYNIKHIAQDRQGAFWIGSNTLRLGSSSMYDFKDLVNDVEDSQSLIDNNVYGLSRGDSGDIIVSTSAGLCILDIEKSTFSIPTFLKKEERTFGVTRARESNQVWVGTYNNLIKVDLEDSNILKKYNRDIIVDDQNNILRRACRILEDSGGKVWMIDHWGRLKHIEQEEDKITNFIEIAQDKETGRFLNCLAILDDPKNKQVIVGMDRGLALVSYDELEVTMVALSHDDVDLSKANYSYLYRDLQDRIWTIIDGKAYIIDLNYNTLDFLNLNEQYGVGSFKWIVEEPKHSFWLSSFRGIIRYDEKEARSSIYYTPNVGGTSFNTPSPVIQSNGKIYFSGNKGITILDPNIVSPDDSDAHVVISDLKINQESIKLNQPIYIQEELKLGYMFNDINLSFTNFSFVNQEDCQYRYRLLPRDEGWIENGNNHTLALYNLPPDDYTFEVEASNSEGIWTNQVAQLRIIIPPPWWKTIWARVLFFAFGIGLVMYLQYYLYQVKLEKQFQLESLRSKISRDLHDDVGTVLTGIAMQSELLEDFADDKTKHIARHIAHKTREAMGTMRDTVWAMDIHKDTIGDLKDRMLDFVEDALIPKEILTHFTSDITDETKIKPDVRQAIFLIFKESIVNIAKHSDTKIVEVELGRNDKHIYLFVQDQGSESAKVKTSGQGIQNMKERAEGLHGSYKFSYRDGYRAEVMIPL